jgi:hypothetical protein
MKMENEEQALFINEFTPTKAHYIQGYRMLFGLSKAKAAVIFGVLGGSLLLVALTRLIFGDPLVDSDNKIVYILVLAAAALEAVLYFWLPGITAKNTLGQQQEGYGQAVTLKTVFGEDGVSVFDAASKGEMHFAYDVFVRCMETEELLLMRTKSKQALLLLKTGFTRGNEGEFREFIHKKCPGAKINWKKGI